MCMGDVERKAGQVHVDDRFACLRFGYLLPIWEWNIGVEMRARDEGPTEIFTVVDGKNRGEAFFLALRSGCDIFAFLFMPVFPNNFLARSGAITA